MSHEFRQYRLARIEGYNITHTSLESRFHRGIGDLGEFEKAIAEQLAAPSPTTVVAWRQSELEQQGCREGIRLAALEFYWQRRHQIRLGILGEKQGGSFFGAFGTGFFVTRHPRWVAERSPP